MTVGPARAARRGPRARTPFSRVIADALLHWRGEGALLADVAAGAAEPLRRHLMVHRLRAKVDIS
eukprot:gene23950-51468_t